MTVVVVAAAVIGALALNVRVYRWWRDAPQTTEIATGVADIEELIRDAEEITRNE